MHIYLSEFEDSRWCPQVLRRFALEHLRTVFTLTRPYQRVEYLLRDAVIESGAQRVIDLCSGSGGPWETLSRPLPVLLTDLFPPALPTLRLPNGVTYREKPLDARDAPLELNGFFTMFTAFHHLSAKAAQTLLEEVRSRGEGIAIFESTERSWRSAWLVILCVASAFALAPFTKPLSLRRLLFTYIVPVVPALLLYDGIVSVLRSYTVNELQELSNKVEEKYRNHYRWTCGRFNACRLLPPITFLVGVPSDLPLAHQPAHDRRQRDEHRSQIAPAHALQDPLSRAPRA